MFSLFGGFNHILASDCGKVAGQSILDLLNRLGQMPVVCVQSWEGELKHGVLLLSLGCIAASCAAHACMQGVGGQLRGTQDTHQVSNQSWMQITHFFW